MGGGRCGRGEAFCTLNQLWNVHLIIPRNPPGLFVLQHRFTSPNIPRINHYFITSHNWQEAWTTSVSRPLHWHVHASVCVCVSTKIKKKLLSLTHHSCLAEMLSFSGTVSLFFPDFPLGFWRKPGGIARRYGCSLTGKENDWCYCSGDIIKDKPMKSKCHIFSPSQFSSSEETARALTTRQRRRRGRSGPVPQRGYAEALTGFRTFGQQCQTLQERVRR